MCIKSLLTTSIWQVIALVISKKDDSISQWNPCFTPIVLVALLLTLKGILVWMIYQMIIFISRDSSSGSGLGNHGYHGEINFQLHRCPSDCRQFFRYVLLPVATPSHVDHVSFEPLSRVLSSCYFWQWLIQILLGLMTWLIRKCINSVDREMALCSSWTLILILTSILF